MIPVLKRPKTIYEVLKPLLLISRMGAVCTVVKSKEKEQLVLSKLMVFIQTVVMIISVTHLAFIPYAVIYIEQIPEISSNENETAAISSLSSQKFITKMTNIVLISLTAIVVRMSSLLQMHKFLPTFVEDINEFDQLIVGHHSNTDYVWILTISVLVVLVSWPYQFYSILIVTTDNWMAFLMFYLNLYNNFSVILSEFQFIGLCWILQSRFKELKSRLESLNSKENLDDVDLTMTRIIRVKNATKLLVDAFYKLSCLCSFQLLVMLSDLTLNTLFGLYFSIYGAGFTKHSDKTSLSFQKISNIANDVIWSFYYFIRFVFICMVAGHLSKRANGTKILVSNLIRSSLPKNIKEELWEFLTYATTNKLQFSACGFFKINISLITSTVSMGTTYLVILAQFQSRRY